MSIHGPDFTRAQRMYDARSDDSVTGGEFYLDSTLGTVPVVLVYTMEGALPDLTEVQIGADGQAWPWDFSAECRAKWTREIMAEGARDAASAGDDADGNVSFG